MSFLKSLASVIISLIPLRKFRGSFYGDGGRKENNMGRLGESMRIEGRGG